MGSHLLQIHCQDSDRCGSISKIMLAAPFAYNQKWHFYPANKDFRSANNGIWTVESSFFSSSSRQSYWICRWRWHRFFAFADTVNIATCWHATDLWKSIVLSKMARFCKMNVFFSNKIFSLSQLHLIDTLTCHNHDLHKLFPKRLNSLKMC